MSTNGSSAGHALPAPKRGWSIRSHFIALCVGAVGGVAGVLYITGRDVVERSHVIQQNTSTIRSELGHLRGRLARLDQLERDLGQMRVEHVELMDRMSRMEQQRHPMDAPGSMPWTPPPPPL